MLDQQQKEMQQLRRELSSIQKAKDRCGQEVSLKRCGMLGR